ncbi:MAG: hypothetical protein JWL71_3487 [Acidobacteria bacterium]|nr:hypothetical protein [Acidobacteriota bacterium]
MTRMLLVLALATTAACSEPVDVAKAVQVQVISSGWLPAGSTGGKNKIVPAVAMTLKNASGQTLNALQVNAVFRLVSSNDEIASDFHPVPRSRGLPPGASTDTLTLKATRGYTGADPFEDLLSNSQFVDAKVEVFVKAGPGQWTRLGEYPIAREFTGS